MQTAAVSLEEQNRQTQLMLNEYFEQACSIQQILGQQYQQKNYQNRQVEVQQKEVHINYKDTCYKDIAQYVQEV